MIDFLFGIWIPRHFQTSIFFSENTNKFLFLVAVMARRKEQPFKIDYWPSTSSGKIFIQFLKAYVYPKKGVLTKEGKNLKSEEFNCKNRTNSKSHNSYILHSEVIQQNKKKFFYLKFHKIIFCWVPWFLFFIFLVYLTAVPVSVTQMLLEFEIKRVFFNLRGIFE